MLENSPVLLFSKISEFREVIDFVAKSIKSKKSIGSYIPQTVIIDNLSTAQVMFEEQARVSRQGVGNQALGESVLEQRDWGVFDSSYTHAMVTLHDLPAHIIWIAHTKIVLEKDFDEKGKAIMVERGATTLRGSVKNFIPGNCDILYSEKISRGPFDPSFFLYDTKKGIWGAGIRRGRLHKPFPQGALGPNNEVPGIHPSYDDLAPYLGLKTKEQLEKEKQNGKRN